MSSLVVDPDLPYAELAARLRALGWQWRREAQTLPTIPGEPEHVVWAHEASETLLVYTFNPVVMLRVLAFSGAGADAQLARTASFVPHLTLDAIADLIADERTEPCLLGMFAAQELELAAAIPLVEARAADPDELIAEVARDVARRLPAIAIESARDTIGRALASCDDPAGVFALFATAPLRRQVVRHAAAAMPADGEMRPASEFLVRAGLGDRDWETRASAMIAAARLGLRDLGPAVAELALPTGDESPLAPRDRARLATVHRAARSLLAGAAEPRDERERHARRCVERGEDGVFDGLFLLVHALSAPLDLAAGPPALPACVVATDDGPALARSGLPLRWVGPAPCWLGDPDDADNPLRHVVPSRGFFMAARPLSRAVARWLRAGGTGPIGAARGDEAEDVAVPLDEARELVAALAAVEDAAIELPGADQWEMAARGTDGRRYPWGNGREDHPGRRTSPWAFVGMTGGAAHWTRSPGADPIACGGDALACHVRRVQRDGVGVVRPIIAAPRA